MATKKELTDFAVWMNSRRHKDFRMTRKEIEKEVSVFYNEAEAPLFPDNERKDSKTLFRNSSISKLNDFTVHFSGPEFQNVDLYYYYNAVFNWSDSSNKKRTKNGWIATAKNFMMKDKANGKLKILTNSIKERSEMLNFLSR